MANQGSYTAINLPVDGTTIDASDVNTDVQGLINEFNKSIDDNKIASSAGIASSKLADGNAFVPVGGIIMYWSAGGAAPTNWQYCDGTVVSDGASTLNGLTLPNIMGSKFVRGVTNANLRTTPSNGGADTHTLDITEIPAHTHLGSATFGVVGGGPGANADITTGGGHYNQGEVSAGGGAAHNNVPAYIGMTYIIRLK